MARQVQFFRAVWLAALFFSGVARAADSAEFVMLIDLSSRMASRREATARTIRDLAATGIHGRMQEGQTLTLWFYDTAFSTNMPPLVWDSRRAGEFAQRAEESFKAKKFLKVGRPKGPTLQPVVGKTDWFTAMILTDGYLPFSGTPFDNEINSSLSAERDRFAREKKPFLVTLLARKGEWMAFNVHTNLTGAVELPRLPENWETMEKAVAVLRGAMTNSTKPKPMKVAPVVEKPKIEEPIAIAPIKPIEKPIEAALVPKIKEQETAPKVQTQPVQVSQKPPDEPKAVNDPPKAEVPEIKQMVELAPSVPAPPIASQSSNTAQAPPVAALVQVAPARVDFPWPLLLAGFGMFAAVGALVYLRLAQSTPPARGSLISQSLDSERGAKHSHRSDN
jgi:hypothetical protein